MGSGPSRVHHMTKRPRDEPEEPEEPEEPQEPQKPKEPKEPKDPAPVAVKLLTARDLGARLHQGGWLENCEIELACGVVIPQLRVMLMGRILTLYPESGKIQCNLIWEPDDSKFKLAHLSLVSFFHGSPLPHAYREALARRTQEAGYPQLRAPHVFMLLIDELVYWATKIHGMIPGCDMELQDVVNLDYATGPTPFALRGRHVFSGIRDSRYLQNERGYGYYETFGFWPVGVPPHVYLLGKSRLSGRVGTAPGDADYSDTAEEVNREQSRDMRKTLPPVLPPLAGGDVRVFADMDDYYRRVLVAGSYGQAAGVPRPVREPGAPAELPVREPGAPVELPELEPVGAELPRLDAAELIAAMRMSALPSRWGNIDAMNMSGLAPAVVEGIPVMHKIRPTYTHNDGTYHLRLGDWRLHCTPHKLRIDGPLSRVAQVTRLAVKIADELAPRAPIIWDFKKHHRERVYVRGAPQQTGDGLFLARGTEMLLDLGYVPWGWNMAPVIQKARRADAQFARAFVAAPHPRFGQLSRIAQALGQDRWILWRATTSSNDEK